MNIKKNKLQYAFLGNSCKKHNHYNFKCYELQLVDIQNDNICEIQLLNMKNSTTGQQTFINEPKAVWI